MMRARTLVFALGLTIAATACTVSGQAAVGVETTPVVYQEPPQPQVETVSARPGFLWVKGRWNWQNGQWAWIGGHWERERAGYAWSEGRWERRGNRWEWVAGTWTVSSTPVVETTVTTTHTESNGGGVVVTGSVSAYPNGAPPPVRVETYGQRAGFVWISGRWDWRNGNWAWGDGHWERERANQVWVTGRWESQGGHWTWVEGRWDVHAAAPAGPVVRDHR